MSSANLLNISTAFYLFCIFAFISNLLLERSNIRKLAVIFGAIGFLIQTMALLTRWSEAGFVEVAAFEQATATELSGLAWFVIFTQHPPWSNLYEIMVYMGWGIFLVTLVCETLWRVKLATIFGLIFGLCCLGVASLNDGMIKPLVPALKSWWIMIHVISAAIAYASGSIAAVMSLMYLIKSKLFDLKKLYRWALCLNLILLLLINKGFSFLWTLQYPVKLLKDAGGGLTGNVVDLAAGQAFVYINAPGMGLVFLLFFASLLLGLFLSMGSNSRLSSRKPVSILLWLPAFFGCLVFARWTYLGLGNPAASITNLAVQPSIEGPYFIGFRSDPWGMALLGIGLVALIFITASTAWPERIRARLPAAEKLDNHAYLAILFSFALMALVLVTGALWAHYAWGRYWAWDPKEVGALMIWLNYALYLHTRISYKWDGVVPAGIAIFGFFVIIAGFLGVNLGWFAEGLHSYGAA